MNNNNKQIFNTKTALLIAGMFSLSISTVALAHTDEDKSKIVAKTDTSLQQTDFTPDSTKRLTLAALIKGSTRLHDYLKNAVEKANEADKKFLSKEKAEVERQLSQPQAAYDDLFNSIDEQINRLKKQKLFPAALVGEMRKHFLETSAVKAMNAMQKEGKKPGVNDAFKAEMRYQLGIVAFRDQVNYKTALRHYEKAVQLSPTNTEYLTALGDIYLLIEEKGSAAKLYKDLLVLLKKNSASAVEIQAVKGKLMKVK
jgi:tetratricopeptide (TPR) repeat protein